MDLKRMAKEAPLVSIIIPIHNGEKWVNSCFESIMKQDILQKESVEISVYSDCCTDKTSVLLKEWEEKISQTERLSIVISYGDDGPKGVGYAKNRAVEKSSGTYLCFQDIDDIMLPSRIKMQLDMARQQQNAIVGCRVRRIPENSTQRFMTWANYLPQNLLDTQIYTSHGPTVLMPTWFFHRTVFDRIGGFSEEGKGMPEDLLFFYRHLDEGGNVCRVDEVLLVYRYHPDCTTFTIDESTIWNIRLQHFEEHVLPKWQSFTIWNAGKQGRRFYRSLKTENRKKVARFCDVDMKKMGKYYEPYSKLVDNRKTKVPIVHFTEADPPFVVCMKLDLTEGEFERNLDSLNLIEGKDYVLFS